MGNKLDPKDSEFKEPLSKKKSEEVPKSSLFGGSQPSTSGLFSKPADEKPKPSLSFLAGAPASGSSLFGGKKEEPKEEKMPAESVAQPAANPMLKPSSANNPFLSTNQKSNPFMMTAASDAGQIKSKLAWNTQPSAKKETSSPAFMPQPGLFTNKAMGSPTAKPDSATVSQSSFPSKAPTGGSLFGNLAAPAPSGGLFG